MKDIISPSLKVADQAWIAAALLHRDKPDRIDFTVDEILERAQEEAPEAELRPGVRVHILQHCVANRPANPGRYRMLYETGRGRRRLFRSGDAYHATRKGGKVVPFAEQVPEKYAELLKWYEREYDARRPEEERESILGLRGLGKEIWKGLDPDEYVRQLREGWE